MASGHAGRMSTYFGSMGNGGDPTVDSPRTRVSRGTYTQPLNAKQKSESPARDDPKDFTPSSAAVIEQWICFVLGAVCIACGAFAIFAQPIQGPPSASVAWLGAAYMPTLQFTALLCFFMGLLLVRRGWSGPDRKQKRSEHERQP